jgi:hypothetical protein
MLIAYDAASRLLADDPDDLDVAYVAALALARSGALDRAAGLTEELRQRIDAEPDVEAPLQAEIAALEARIAKDRALRAAPQDQPSALVRAAELYEAVADTYGGHYPLVNAATLRLLAGDHVRAHELARTAIDTSEEGDDATDEYWRQATIAEASLVLGDTTAAAEALDRAVQTGAADLASRAATQRQLVLVCHAIGHEQALLDRLRLPTVIHYCGHVASNEGTAGRFPLDEQDRVADEIKTYLDQHDVGVAYGSLASGADILVAEAVLARGGELRVVVPFGADEFVDVSVTPGGASWKERFERCLEQAADVFVACDSAYGGDDELFLHASRIAMGMAHNRAAMLGTAPRQLAVWDGQPARGPGGTADDIATWGRIGNVSDVIAVQPVATKPEHPRERRTERTVRAFIFADLHGFGQLRDEHFRVALRSVFAPLGEVLAKHGSNVLYRNTWGDGLHVVLPTAGAAARCALDLQDALRDVDGQALGLPSSLGLRVAVHVGPVMSLPNPVLDVPGWWGRELTRTARIEPRTPEGEVYSTEQFAALLVLEPDSGVTCEYVGRVTTAKAFETIPMYRIGRSAHRSPPG